MPIMISYLNNQNKKNDSLLKSNTYKEQLNDALFFMLIIKKQNS